MPIKLTSDQFDIVTIDGIFPHQKYEFEAMASELCFPATHYPDVVYIDDTLLSLLLAIDEYAIYQGGDVTLKVWDK